MTAPVAKIEAAFGSTWKTAESYPWTAQSGTWGINTNKAYMVSGASGVATQPLLADGTVQFTFSTIQDACGMAFRVRDSSNLFTVQYVSAFATYNVNKWVGGAATNLGNTGLSGTSGDIVKVVLSGSSIGVYLNAALVLSVTDSAFDTETDHGFYCGAAAGVARFDDFSFVGSIPTVTDAFTRANSTTTLGSATSAQVWTDITAYVRESEGISASRGRRSVQEQFSTGSLSLSLNNETRRFDTLYSAGTYFGQLKPGVPIRVTTTPSGQSSRSVWRGFISGFPQRYDIGNTLSVVPIAGYGVFDKLARAKLPQSAVDVEVLADNPVAYWKLDDTAEAEMLDSSGNDRHGTYDNPALQQDALVADGGNAVFFDHVGDHRGKVTADLVTVFPISLETWVKFPRDLAAFHALLYAQRDTTLVPRFSLIVDSNPGSYSGTDGAVIIEWGYGGTRVASGGIAVDDDERHHVVAVLTTATSWALYVDGVADSLTMLFSGTPTSPWSNIARWTIGNVLNIKSGDFGLGGTIDNVAVYPSALSAARVLSHYNSGVSPWDGDTPDIRLGRILDVIGLPSDRRSFEVCTTLLGPTVLGQQRALDYMRLVEASEDGRMFETADGKVRFLNRYWGVTDAHATSSQVTFSDTGSISYRDLDIDPDDELLVNICTVQREGGAALTISNQTSVDTYGPADTSISVLLQTDAEARSLAEHVVLVRGTPAERVSKLRVPLHKYTGAQQASILDLEIGYLITVNRTPQKVGSAMALSLIIEGIEHTISSTEHWIEFNVSVAPRSGDYWIWGTSTWGETTVWGW
jgi:hypothetical protein